MRALSVVWFKVLPAKYGGQKGTALFNQHLASYVELTCLCSKNNQHQKDLPYHLIANLPTSKLQFLNPLCWFQLIACIKKTKADVLILEYPYYGVAAILAKKITGIRLILHEHNIEYKRFRNLKKKWWRLLFCLERMVVRHADLVLFKTKQNLAVAAEKFSLPRERCLVVPYGVEKRLISTNKVNIRQKHGLSPEAKLILFAGTLDYEPNAEAVVNIYQHLAAELEKENQLFQILICGRLKEKRFHYLKKKKHPKIFFIGEVEDIEPYFAAADVFINPLFYPGGIQTKILDALTWDCPVVAFENAVEGFDTALAAEKIFSVENGNWGSFATAIKKASLQNTKTPNSFFEYYNWNVIAKNTYERLHALYSADTAKKSDPSKSLLRTL